MSDVNVPHQAWRRDLEQTGNLSADEIAELESHLADEMDALQKSGLQTDEAFMIATRRLGHPHQLAAEYAKNDTVAFWKGPAKLLLWGLLLVEALNILGMGFSFLCLATGLENLLGPYFFSLRNLPYGVSLIVLLYLAGNPQSRIAQGLARIESAIQTQSGAMSLILGAALLEIIHISLGFFWYWCVTKDEYDHFSPSTFIDMVLRRVLWLTTVAILLVILARIDSHRKVGWVKTHLSQRI